MLNNTVSLFHDSVFITTQVDYDMVDPRTISGKWYSEAKP